LRELADKESWRDLELHNKLQELFLRELMQESWWDLEPHNFLQGFFLRELADTESYWKLEPYNFPQGFFLRELMQKVGGVWSSITFG